MLGWLLGCSQFLSFGWLRDRCLILTTGQDRDRAIEETSVSISNSFKRSVFLRFIANHLQRDRLVKQRLQQVNVDVVSSFGGRGVSN